MSDLRIGFIGLGLMGAPMAKNLIKAGFPVIVYNRTANKTREFVKLGCTVVGSPQELHRFCDVIITIVTGPKDVEEVLFGKEGIVHGIVKKEKLTIIDMSTIGPQAAKKISKNLEKYKVEFIDAPVTGGTRGAIDGTLTIFAGGKKSIFEKIKPVLEGMGKNIHYMGQTGSGQAIKLVNNLLVGETITALAEAMLLADQMGLKRRQVVETLSEVPAVSGFMKMKMPNMEKDHHPVSFSVANLRKDLGLAQDEMKKSKKKLPLLKAVFSAYNKGIKKGHSGLDISAILRIISDETP
jgi:3-hydroxyisobutyrate dehydrogenase